MAKKVNKMNDINVVEFSGKVTKMVAKSDKVTKFVVDNQKTSDNNKIIHTYMTCILFEKNDEIKVEDKVRIVGTLSTSSYNGKFRVDIIADAVEVQ